MRWKAGLKYATLLPQRKWQFNSDRVIGQPGKETDLWITDDIIQKSHIEKELLSHLDGIKTVFDGGAGCGRFSILLAKHGLEVTHFDISQPMIPSVDKGEIELRHDISFRVLVIVVKWRQKGRVKDF